MTAVVPSVTRVVIAPAVNRAVGAVFPIPTLVVLSESTESLPSPSYTILAEASAASTSFAVPVSFNKLLYLAAIVVLVKVPVAILFSLY